MGRARYGFYRGKSRFQTFLKALIVLLLIILLLAVAAFFLLEKYMVYSVDGAHLQLPWWGSAQATTPPELQPSPIPTLVVDEPEATPTPTQDAKIQAVLLPRTALYDGTAARQIAAAGGNAAVFDMKADEGSLGYVSNLQQAIEARTSAADPALNAAIRGMNGGDLYTVARVSCFRDNTMPRYRNSAAIRTNGGNWRDVGSHRWLDPANEDAQQYIIDICRELADLGFDELLLDNSGYPTTGKLNLILNTQGAAATPEGRTQVLTSFYQALVLAMADYPQVKISVMGTAAMMQLGNDPDSGQSITALVEHAHQIWVIAPEAGAASYIRALEEAGAVNGAAKMVQVGVAAGAPEDNWAVLGTQLE